MLDKWAPWYKGGHRADSRYGDATTYQLGADWLDGLDVEDWGCGFARFRDYHRAGYKGIDGTPGWCDVVADLTVYRSQTPGLFMRHVLEHNVQWRQVLDNAAASATQRLVVCVFTPDGDGSHIGWTDELGVPDIAVPWDEIGARLTLAGWHWSHKVVPSATYYREEAVWLASRS